MTKIQEKYDAVLAYFRQNMPMAQSELDFSSPFELLVAVVLSAQCTDKRVNIVTKELFKAYPTPEAMAAASVEAIYQYIKSISYPNNKAKHLSEMSKALVERFNAQVPADREALMTLPGVGRKTANVMLCVAFNTPAMPVDTHVFRVSHRMGLVSDKDNTVDKVEQTLVKHIPLSDLGDAHHYLLLHGRYVCTAKKPQCSTCPIEKFCAKKGV